MPIYDFHCPACGHTFEQLVKLNESPACPACAHAETERQFSFSAGIRTDTTARKSHRAAERVRNAKHTEIARVNHEYMKHQHGDHHH